jgi:hypothetical protein
MKDGWNVQKESSVLTRRDYLLAWILALCALAIIGSILKVIFFRGSHSAWGVAFGAYAIFSITFWLAFCYEHKDHGLLCKLSRLPAAFILPAHGILTLAWYLIGGTFGQTKTQSKPPTRHRTKQVATSGLAIGDRVVFSAPGSGRIEGVVARFNKKTVKVISQPDEYWNVPPESLTKIRSAIPSRKKGSGLQLVRG